MRKIKTGDEVIVLTGKDKGRRGTVERLIGDDKLVVGGINMIKKHQKGNPQAGDPGGILDREAPIQISNVAVYNPSTKKGDRIGFRFENGKKIRFFKSDDKAVDI